MMNNLHGPNLSAAIHSQPMASILCDPFSQQGGAPLVACGGVEPL